MQRIRSFPPISRSDARVLILGSMPGAKSLSANEYYAHRGNAFWGIMGELIGAGWDKDYATRVQILEDNGIALWDVLKACVRAGSQDADIEEEEANDLRLFFQAHPRIQKIGLNGSKAAESFEGVTRSYNLSQICAKLPSTSSANSRLTREQKRDVWRDFILS